MNTEYLDAEWGKNIERIVFRTVNDRKKAVYQASELQTNRTVVYLEMGGNISVAIVGRIDTHKTSGNVTGGQARIQLDIPGSAPITLNGHIERIPYGFDRPKRYELIVDQPIEVFEALGEYEELRHELAKEAALKKMISSFINTEEVNKIK